MLIPLTEIKNDTGIVFGYAGAPYLSVAVDQAAKSGRVVVVSAANMAALNDLRGNEAIVGVVPVYSPTELLNTVLPELRTSSVEFDAIVFHGLSEYAQMVLTEICRLDTPTQAQWGEMARRVANDLRRLTAVKPVVYVTADVVVDEEGKPRFNINPGLSKLIMGDLVTKLYVAQRANSGVMETVVQDNPTLALQFIAPKREKAEGEAGNGTEPKRPGRKLR